MHRMQAEILKNANEDVIMEKVCNVYLEEGKVPETELIVSIPKKANLAECSNWQGETIMKEKINKLFRCSQKDPVRMLSLR